MNKHLELHIGYLAMYLGYLVGRKFASQNRTRETYLLQPANLIGRTVIGLSRSMNLEWLILHKLQQSHILHQYRVDTNLGQLINEAMNQLEYYHCPYGADLDEIRYKGMAVASNGGSSTVFVILEVQATMNKDTSSEDHLTYYWYTGFTEVYKSGELDDTYIVHPSTKISVSGWDGTGFTSIDALRKAIVHLTGDGNYDLQLEE